MSRADYDRWEAAGEPFRLARPLADLRDLLRRYGYTVYDIGNMDHLLHEPPEDHTPYSKTGWPQAAAFGVGYAIDIMPPKAGSGLPSLAQLGAQLYADRQAGVSGLAWLKYANWEPGDGNCWHDSWQPTHARRDSSDRGHIHLSGRTDFQTSTIAAGYDPVARIREADVALTDAEKDDIAARVWKVSFREYVDQNGNKVRDSRTMADFVLSMHGLAVDGEDAVAAEAAVLADIKTTLAALGAGPSPDLDVLADKLFDRFKAAITGEGAGQ